MEICPIRWITTLLPMIPTYTSPKHKVSNLNKIHESLGRFGTKMISWNRIKTRNWKKTSASWRYVQFSELQHYFPMIPTYTSHKDKVSNLNKIMNLWNDWGLKWAPETESKPEIERKHLHHRVMSNSVNYNTTYQWSQHTHLLSTKCPIWIK